MCGIMAFAGSSQSGSEAAARRRRRSRKGPHRRRPRPAEHEEQAWHSETGIGFAVALVTAVGAPATGCSVVSKVKQAVHTVESNKSTITRSPRTCSRREHAFRGHVHDDGKLPGHGRLRGRPVQRRASPSTRHRRERWSNVQVIVNSSGEYVCNQSGSAGAGRARSSARLTPPREQDLRHVHPLALDLLPEGRVAGGGIVRRQGRHLTKSLNGFDMTASTSWPRGRRGQHHLQHVAGHPRLRQRGVGLDELPDHRLLVVSLAVAVPAAPGATVTTSPHHDRDGCGWRVGLDTMRG